MGKLGCHEAVKRTEKIQIPAGISLSHVTHQDFSPLIGSWGGRGVSQPLARKQGRGKEVYPFLLCGIIDVFRIVFDKSLLLFLEGRGGLSLSHGTSGIPR